jgi:triacylglycerol lipase
MLPVVLHHGLFGRGDIQVGPVKISYFRKIDRAIVARGHPLIVTTVHPCSSVQNRARQLKESILRQLSILGRENDKVILIAHSMGGLDARYAVAKLGMADRVAALVTISCPHRGSSYADWIVQNLGRRLGGMQLVNFLGLDMRALIDVTTKHCARFNREIPNVPGVPYFSISASRPWNRVPPYALHSHHVVQAAEGANDGLVSVKSSTWGEHLGVWPADHWHAINRRRVIELSEPTGDITPYWMRMLDEVDRRLGDGNGVKGVSGPLSPVRRGEG